MAHRNSKNIFEDKIKVVPLILEGINVISYVASVLLIALLIYEYGFVISDEVKSGLRLVYKGIWITYLVAFGVNFTLGYENAKKETRYFGWVVDALLLSTLIPVIFRCPDSGSLVFLWKLLHSHYFRLVLLLLISFQNLSAGITKLLGKRTNPSLILAISFFVIIVIGTGLLMTPRATVNGISFTDALFTATSAVCVTGLTTVDVSSVFTTVGHSIIILLIQIGGLGVMTFTSFFAVFFMGESSIYNQVVMKDMVNSKSLNSLLSTLLYILLFTVVIEAFGAFLIWISIHGTMNMTFEQEIGFSVFHSISAFCNAGFSTLYNNLNNPMVLENHNMLFLVISGLVIFGGIGFPILVNLKDVLFFKIRNLFYLIIRKPYKVHHKKHLFNLNTKIVLLFTFILLVAGTVLIAVIEWNNSLSGLPVADKLTQSFFNAVVPRTAGFIGVDINTFMPLTIFITIILMIIGGGSQSTAGGLKVNAFAVIVLNLKSVLRNSDRVEAFKRTISTESIQRANATLMIQLVVLFIAVTIITFLEPDKSFTAIIFECVSAVNTVGSSLNLTPSLGAASKYIVIALMFIGRVGILTFMLSFIKPVSNQKYQYPSDNIIIN